LDTPDIVQTTEILTLSLSACEDNHRSGTLVEDRCGSVPTRGQAASSSEELPIVGAEIIRVEVIVI